MGWKQFFKLTWNKLTLLFIINTLTITMKTLALKPYTYDTGIVYIFVPFSWILGHLMLPVITGAAVGTIAIIWNLIVFSISHFLDLFWQYSISCVIILIYHYVRKGASVRHG